MDYLNTLLNFIFKNAVIATSSFFIPLVVEENNYTFFLSQGILNNINFSGFFLLLLLTLIITSMFHVVFLKKLLISIQRRVGLNFMGLFGLLLSLNAINQELLSLQIITSFCVFVIHFGIVFMVYVYFLLHTPYNFLVYYGLVALENLLIKNKMLVWWFLAISFCFFGLYTQMLSGTVAPFDSMVSCTPFNDKLNKSVSQIPAYDLAFYKNNGVFQGALSKVFTPGEVNPYNLISAQTGMFSHFFRDLKQTLLVLKNDYVFRGKVLLNSNPIFYEDINSLSKEYAEEIYPKMRLFNFSGLNSHDLSLEASPASFVRKEYGPGLLAFFEKLSEFSIELTQFKPTDNFTAYSEITSWNVYQTPLTQIECNSLLTDLSRWKKSCYSYMRDEALRTNFNSCEFYTLFSLLDPCLKDRDLNSYLHDQNYIFLETLESKVDMYTNFFNYYSKKHPIWDNFCNFEFFNKVGLSFLIQQDLFIYSWLRIEHLTELNAFDSLTLEIRVLSSLSQENYFEAIQDRIASIVLGYKILANASSNLEPPVLPATLPSKTWFSFFL